MEPKRGSSVDKNLVVTSSISEEQFYQTLRSYVIDAQKKIYVAINAAMVTAYWKIGHDINEACGENVVR